eukprot:372921_1
MEEKVPHFLQSSDQKSSILGILNEDAKPLQKDTLYKHPIKKKKTTEQTATIHNTCLKESFYLSFAWLGYVIHLIFALLPSNFFNGKMTMKYFYKNHSIQISSVNWTIDQWSIQLSLGFYYGLALANICLAMWYICTEHQSYFGRAVLWLAVAICLFYSNYILLKHMYYDASRVRFNSVPAQKDQIDPTNSIHQLPIRDNLPDINNSNVNVKAGSIQSCPSGYPYSPMSSSIEISTDVAQKIVYDAAEAANKYDKYASTASPVINKHLGETATREKYTGLIFIVVNGASYVASVVCIDFWVQMGVLMRYGFNIDDHIASVVAIILIYICISIYYFLDFYYFEQYFVHNVATHIVLCITLAAMLWKYLFQGHKDDGDKRSFFEIFQMIIILIIAIVTLIKIMLTIRIHRKYKTENNGYKFVI